MILSTKELAQRMERSEASGGVAWVEARQRISPDAGSDWISVAGAYAMFDGPDSPVTQTFGLGLFAETTTADLDRLERFFAERGAPVNHEVSPLAGVPLAAMLADRGYKPVEFTSVMVQPVRRIVAAANPRLTTRRMEPGEEDLWARINVKGWGAEHPELERFLMDLGRLIAASVGTTCFFAELDGKPVAAAGLRIYEGMAHFAGASTIPEARRQGAQLALLNARMAMAEERGCDLVMMGAEPGSASQRNAERQGFRIAYTRVKWSKAT